MKFKFRSILVGVFLVVCLFTSSVSAATVTKVQSLTTNYYDSIITSWKVGSFKATYTYSYNDSTKKLVDQKSISTSSSGTFISYSEITKTWNWYNTSTYKGTGNAEAAWKAGFGVDTTWFKIGDFHYYWMTLTCKGDGSWSSSFS